MDNIENKLFMRIRDATNHGHRTAWTLGETPYFDTGETREFLAESKDFDVVGGQLTPQANTDYAASTESDGAGTDITAQLSVTYPADPPVQRQGHTDTGAVRQHGRLPDATGDARLQRADIQRAVAAHRQRTLAAKATTVSEFAA